MLSTGLVAKPRFVPADFRQKPMAAQIRTRHHST